MKRHVLHRVQLIPRPRSEVFAFFEDATNLARITPDFLGFEILTPAPIAMRPGTLIDYRIRLFGLPMRWRTEIETYEPGERFVDRQLRGPYRLWRHTHAFRAVPGGTEMTDTVEYAIGFGVFGEVARALFVRRTLEQIFDHRARVIVDLLRDDAATPRREQRASSATSTSQADCPPA